MTNGKVTFDLDGVKRSLYFGMVATQIFKEKAGRNAIQQAEELESLEKDLGKVKAKEEWNNLLMERKTSEDLKAFVFIVFGGLCNQAHLRGDNYPTFEQAYELAERICYVDKTGEMQSLIYTTWSESQPAKDMLEQLPKSVEELTPKGRKKKVSQS